MKARIILLFLVISFYYMLSVEASNGCNAVDPVCGVVPVDNCDVNNDLTFEYGSYYLPNGTDICKDGVTLDCNGAILIGNEFSSVGDTGINVLSNNAVIKNCNIKRYQNGIEVFGSNSNISNNNITITLVGINIPNISGNNAEILSNIFLDNYLVSINIGGGNSKILNNTFSGRGLGETQLVRILVTSPSNIIKNNNINNFVNTTIYHRATGIAISARDNSVSNNNIRGGLDGINITGNNSKILNNTIRATLNGIRLISSSNLIENNMLISQGEAGILIGGGVHSDPYTRYLGAQGQALGGNNSIIGNTITTSRSLAPNNICPSCGGIEIGHVALGGLNKSNGNIVERNTISPTGSFGTYGVGIYNRGDNSLLSNNRVFNNTYGIIVSGYGNKISKNNISRLRIDPNVAAGTESVGIQLTCFYPYVCGNNYIYANNISNSSGFGIQIKAGISPGIVSNPNTNIISNYISDMPIGIVISNSLGSNISDNIIKRIRGTDGIGNYQSNNSIIDGNYVIYAMWPIHVFKSSNVSILSNVIINSSIVVPQSGIILQTVIGSKIIGNVLKNTTGIGVLSASRIEITNNNISRIRSQNTLAGISLQYANNSFIEDNRVLYYRYGVKLSTAGNNLISRNFVYYDLVTPGTIGSIGIYFDVRATRNNLTENYIFNPISSGNYYGIFAVASDNNLIFNNIFNTSINFDNSNRNFWNVTKHPGRNIINGIFIGGNFYRDYTGNDLDGDGIGDTLLPYNSNRRILIGGDFLPLIPAGMVNINLKKGLNLVSLPINPVDSSLPALFSSVDGKYDAVYYYDSSLDTNKWLLFNRKKPDFLQTLARVDHSQGFWINALNDSTLRVFGGDPASTSFVIKQGWNLIGYPYLQTQLINNTLQGVSSTFTSVVAYNATSKLYKTYNKDIPFNMNTLKTMDLGYGYWINATSNVTWVFENGRYRIG